MQNENVELSRFIRAVQSTEPLDVGTPEGQALYVPHLQGPRDALSRLRAEIRHRQGDGVYLFTGQIGSGKSTQLLRLRHELAGSQCKAYYTDLEDWLNLNTPIDLASLLVSVVASWVEAIGTAAGQRTPAERIGDFFRRTELDLSEISFTAGFDAAKAQLKLALKTDKGFREQLERAMAQNLSSFVRKAHAFVAQLVSEVCPHGEKCVLIVDSLEKIRGYGDEASKVYTSLQNIFLAEGNALRLPGVHVVYSVSPYLLAQNPHLPGILGQGVVVTMPSVHVFKARSRRLDGYGVNHMRELLGRRYPDWERFISGKLLLRIIRDTGGDLRDYLRAIKVVLLEREADPNVSRKELLDVVRAQISPPKLIPSEHIGWMARLERSHEPELGGPITDLVLQTHLATKHVLAYLNGQTWYALHPLLRDWVMHRPEAQLANSVPSAAPAA